MGRVVGAVVFSWLSAVFVHPVMAGFFGVVALIALVAVWRRPRIEVGDGQLVLVRSRSSVVRASAASVVAVERIESYSGAALNGIGPASMAIPDVLRITFVDGETADYYDGLQGIGIAEAGREVRAALRREDLTSHDPQADGS